MTTEHLTRHTARYRAIGDPKREINLDAKSESLVQDSIDTLDHSGFEISAIFDIFHDWKSRQTIAARRALVSLSVLVGGSFWVGIDLSRASIWGLSLGDASLSRFLVLVAVIHIVSVTVYVISRQVDWRVRSAKIKRTTNMITPCREAARKLEGVANSTRVESVEVLIDDFTGAIAQQPTAEESYAAVLFYENELEKAHTVRRWMDAAELICVLVAALYTLYAIARMAWPS